MRAAEKLVVRLATVALAGMMLASSASAQAKPAADNLLSVLSAHGDLHMFATAARQAGMGKMLQQEGPFTVFAPSDRAFLNLSKEDREALMTHPGAMHLLLARYLTQGWATPSAGLKQQLTMAGVWLPADLRDGKWMVNSAELDAAAQHCSNGTIYVLNRFDPGLVHDAVEMTEQQ